MASLESTYPEANGESVVRLLPILLPQGSGSRILLSSVKASWEQRLFLDHQQPSSLNGFPRREYSNWWHKEKVSKEKKRLTRMIKKKQAKSSSRINWPKPVETLGGKTFWFNSKRNQFFEMQHHKGGSAPVVGNFVTGMRSLYSTSPKAHRIVVRISPYYCVASVHSQEEIERHWQWMDEHVIKKLESMKYDEIVPFVLFVFNLLHAGQEERALEVLRIDDSASNRDETEVWNQPRPRSLSGSSEDWGEGSRQYRREWDEREKESEDSDDEEPASLPPLRRHTSALGTRPERSAPARAAPVQPTPPTHQDPFDAFFDEFRPKDASPSLTPTGNNFNPFLPSQPPTRTTPATTANFGFEDDFNPWVQAPPITTITPTATTATTITTTTTTTNNNYTDDERDLCKICYEHPITTVILDCMHSCLCDECSTTMNLKICPICRAPIVAIRKFYKC